MKLSEIIKGLECRRLNFYDADISSIEKDAHNVKRGSLFVCIQGLSGDGHEHIGEALSEGAAAVVCDRNVRISPGMPVIYVDDSRIALNVLCDNFYGHPTEGMSVVGVTGTKGKTSTCFFLEGIYAAAGLPHATIGTAGVRVNGAELPIKFATSSTPDTIDLYKIFTEFKERGVTHVAMEVTAHAFALHKVDLLKFTQGIFTNLSHDHLDFFKTIDNYFEAKKSLFRQSGLAVINADDRHGRELLASVPCRKVSVGIKGGADYVCETPDYTMDGSHFGLSLGGDSRRYFLPIPGEFSVSNALGAMVSAYMSGISPDNIEEGIASVTLIPGRIQSVPNKLGIALIIDYAHAPDGLEKVINAARSFTKGRVITVFGCGGDRDRLKRPVMGRVAGQFSDFVVITSDNPRNEEPEAIIAEIEPGIKETRCEYICEADRAAAIHIAVAMARLGDSVIIAGKGHETYQEFEDRRRVDFDDRLVALAAVKEHESKPEGGSR